MKSLEVQDLSEGRESSTLGSRAKEILVRLHMMERKPIEAGMCVTTLFDKEYAGEMLMAVGKQPDGRWRVAPLPELGKSVHPLRQMFTEEQLFFVEDFNRAAEDFDNREKRMKEQGDVWQLHPVDKKEESQESEEKLRH